MPDPKNPFPIPDPESLLRTNRIARKFILFSLLYLVMGVTVGGIMLFDLVQISPFAHIHLLLLGGVMMMISGVGYKLLPTGFAHKTEVFSLRLAEVHFWLMNVGILGLTGSALVFEFTGSDFFYYSRMGFALPAILGMYLFAFNIWMTFRSP